MSCTISLTGQVMLVTGIRSCLLRTFSYAIDTAQKL